MQELRRVLYGLYAILRLHFVPEEEAYSSRVEEQQQGTSDPVQEAAVGAESIHDASTGTSRLAGGPRAS